MRRAPISLFLLLLSFTFIGNAFAVPIGNDIVDRPSIDGATDIAFIDPTLVFSTAGTIDSWDAYIKAEDGDKWAFQIYRETNTVNMYELVYNDVHEAVGSINGVQNYSATSIFEAQVGDIVGWWFGAGAGVIPYTANISDDVDWTNWRSTPYSSPSVGDVVYFNNDLWSASSQNREYSIAVNYTPSPVPEPATILLLGGGLMGIAGFGRKKFLKK